MTPDRLSRVSIACGLGSVGLFAVALVLLAFFPPAPGHVSGLFSRVGPLLFIMSTFSFLMALVALVTGVKALRRFPADASRSQKIAAWVGVAAGGFYTALAAVPFVIIPLLPQTPDAPPDPSVIGIYRNEKKPEDTTELRVDGTFEVREGSQSAAGTYQVQGSRLTLVLPDGTTAVGSLAGGVITDPGGQRLVKQ